MAFNVVSKIDNDVSIKTVLVSVSDKTGLKPFIEGLVSVNPSIKILSTGGTFGAIETILGKASSKNLMQVSDYTGQMEMQGGLVKTLDFKIYLGILGETYNEAHQNDLKKGGALPIDMVVVNLYPFKSAIAKEGATPEDARGNIDIGGPCMCRASAKNFIRVASVCNPADYPAIIEELKANKGKLSFKTRFELSKKSFAHTADYDTAISAYLSRLSAEEAAAVYQFQN